MFVLQLVYFIGNCHHGTWVLNGCDDYLKYTTIWFNQSSLDFRNWLIRKKFFLKETKLIVYLPWPSWRQSTLFCHFEIEFILCNLFNWVYWSTSLRRFSLLEGARQMSLVLFPQKFRFRDSGHSVSSSILVVEMDCPLRIIKELAS